MGGSRREAQSPPKRKHCASHTDPGCRTRPGVPPVSPPSPHRLGIGISPLGTAPANSQGRRQSAGSGLRPFPAPHLPTTQLCIPTPGPPLGPGGPQMNENEGHPACTEVNSVRSGLLRSTSATQTGQQAGGLRHSAGVPPVRHLCPSSGPWELGGILSTFQMGRPRLSGSTICQNHRAYQ